MKYLILSDIHGSLPVLNHVLDYFEQQALDRILLLGDLLNYGPRNGLPEGLDAMGVSKRLSEYADLITAVRGNCDSEVDQMLLPFPIMSDYAIVNEEGHNIFMTHGHVYNEQHLPATGGIDLFLYGHTHLWTLKAAHDGVPAICNSGSPTFPKGGNVPTFATLCDGTLSVRSLDGTALSQLKVF